MVVAVALRNTSCTRDHAMTRENTTFNGKGQRRCVACVRWHTWNARYGHDEADRRDVERKKGRR